eukprot:1584886-Rhodomonas_salina.1
MDGGREGEEREKERKGGRKGETDGWMLGWRERGESEREGGEGGLRNLGLFVPRKDDTDRYAMQVST